MTIEELPEHVQRNRAAWDSWASRYVEGARRDWASAEINWGELHVREADIQALPADVTGMEVIDLGCGTAYVSAWLAKRGAKPVGIDNSPKQLETARRLQAQHGIEFPLLLGNAETVPYPDASFDYAISEYGAAIWCDPYKWISEAARLLRPGGELMFFGNSVQLMVCTPTDDEDAPVTTKLARPLFGMNKFQWSDSSTEFHIS